MYLIGPVPAPVPALYIASRSACNACGHGLSSSEMPDPERRVSNQPLRAARDTKPENWVRGGPISGCQTLASVW